MTTLEYAHRMLEVARAKLAEVRGQHDPEHQRVKDAKESVAGWVREVERLERREGAA